MHQLKKGMTNVEKITVSKDKTASFYGSGSLDVFATPAMIALIENCALNCVEEALEEGYSTVGTKVDVRHLKATKLGKNVEARVELIVIDDKKLTFKVKAYDEERMIGEGIHKRYIINKKDFLNNL